jgi:hypothetical protein
MFLNQSIFLRTRSMPSSHLPGKFIHQGSASALALDGRMSVFEGCARTGHSTKTCIDHYIDNQYFVYMLHAAKVLARLKDLDDNRHVPMFELLGMDVYEKCVDCLNKLPER